MGVREVGNFLNQLKQALINVHQPSLIVHAARDPVVDNGGARLIYDELSSEVKEFALMNYDNHIIVNGRGSERVHKLIGSFIRDNIK